jgi:hypothetical protein
MVGIRGITSAAEDTGAIARRATESYEARRFEAALEDLRRLLGTTYPHQAAVWWNIAKSLENLDRDAEALAAWRAYLQFESEPPEQRREAQAAVDRLSRAAPGTLEVECDAPELRVRLDEGPLLPCPARFERLAASRHSLTVLAGDTELERRDVVVAADEMRRVRLAAPARLEVVADVAGARVFVGGTLRGDAPVPAFAVRSGRHEIRVEADGYEPFADVVDLPPGAARRLDARLVPRVDATGAAAANAAPWVVTGVGLTILAVGAGFGLAARANEGHPAAAVYNVRANVSFVVGGIATVAGVVWFATTD